jgi:S1-C subfamily serine protease
MRVKVQRYRGWVGGAGLLLLAVLPASGQQAVQPKEQATVVVEGVVREIYRSARQGQTDYLVQVKVNRAESGRSPRERARILLPAPGDDVYVHVAEVAGSRFTLPEERSQVRVYLYPRPQGGWEGAYPEWFDLTARELAAVTPDDPPAAAEAIAPNANAGATMVAVSPFELLGIRAEAISVAGRVVYRIAELVPGGPAQKAGIEAGDVIVAVSDTELTDPGQLAEVLQKAGPRAKLTVLNVRDQKAADVTVELAAAAPAPVPTTVPAAATSRVERLGITIEPTPDGALKVTAVDPGSPAQKAGLEVGDVILGASNVRTPTAATLDQVVRGSGADLTVVVRDSRTGRNVPVSVALAAPAPAAPSRSLGVSIEPVRAGNRAGLRVTALEPGGAAQKAGIEVGDVLLEAGGKALDSPQVLSQAVVGSGPELTITVADSRTGRAVPVKVAFEAVANAPAAPAGQPAPAPGTSRMSAARLGVSTEQVSIRFVPALKVVQVEPGSPAQKAGIEVGDVIFSVNDVVTLTPEQLDEVVAGAKSPELNVTVMDSRSGRKTPVKVNLSGR